MPPAEQGVSPIAGLGLFAAEPASAGEAVLHQTDIGALNHSCDPNLGWRDGETLVAIRDIAAAEELTIDYATFIDDPSFVMNCHCETYRCRQIIEGTDWQIPQLQARYAGQFAPALRRRIEDASR